MSNRTDTQFFPHSGSLGYLDFDGSPVYLPSLDDGLSTAIHIPDGIPFGSSHPMQAWVSLQSLSYIQNGPYSFLYHIPNFIIIFILIFYLHFLLLRLWLYIMAYTQVFYKFLASYTSDIVSLLKYNII